jgi:predicted phosphoribosyltransferase
MPFTDRIDAGKRLAAALAPYREANPVVLALPRGGVPVGAEIAKALGAPLGLMLVRKIGVPGHGELAMGAVVDGEEPIIVRNQDVIDSLRISEAAFAAICQEEIKDIERRGAR